MSDADAISNPGDDWPTRAADTVVGYVDTVRKATTGKAMVISRWAVYGLVLALLAPILLVLGLILGVRALTTLLAWVPWSFGIGFNMDTGEVWLTYIIFGALFFLAGSILWRKKGR